MIHKCHYPKCNRQVDPSLYMCQEHWFQVPIELRENLLNSYRSGQEITKRPSREYLDAAMAIRLHVRNIIRIGMDYGP